MAHIQPIIGRGYDSTDDDDLPLPIRGGVFGSVLEKIKKDGVASRDFVVPFNHNSGWIFKLDRLRYHPTHVRITSDGQLWMRWAFKKVAHAHRWHQLRRRGWYWYATLPIGTKGGSRKAKLDNRHFPHLAVEVIRTLKPGIVAYTGGRCSWSGPGQHMLQLDDGALVTKARVWQHLDNDKVIYKVVAWIVGDETERNMGFVASSIADARLDSYNLVHNEKGLAPVGVPPPPDTPAWARQSSLVDIALYL